MKLGNAEEGQADEAQGPRNHARSDHRITAHSDHRVVGGANLTSSVIICFKL